LIDHFLHLHVQKAGPFASGARYGLIATHDRAPASALFLPAAMTKAQPVLATLLALLLAVPVAQAGDGPFDLTDSIKERLDEAVQRAHAADTPTQKRRILSKAFRDMGRALDRAKQIPGLSTEKEAALNDLQQELEERNNRLNGLAGFAPVPDADLDRFADDVQSNILEGQTITIGLGTALVIVLIIILLA
jgi:hypothetical protein